MTKTNANLTNDRKNDRAPLPIIGIGILLLAAICLVGLINAQAPAGVPAGAGFQATLEYIGTLDDFLGNTIWRMAGIAICVPVMTTIVVGIIRNLLIVGCMAMMLGVAASLLITVPTHTWATEGGIERLTPEVSKKEACRQAANALVAEADDAGGDALLANIDAYRKHHCPDATLAAALDQSSLAADHSLRTLAHAKLDGTD